MYDRYTRKLREQDKYIVAKFNYKFGEFMHRKVNKVIEDVEHVKLMKKWDDDLQQRQLDHVVADMDDVNVDTGAHALKVFPHVDCRSSESTSHRARTL